MSSSEDDNKVAALVAQRQFYTNKVRRLRVLRNPELFVTLDFPQLREAHLLFGHSSISKGLTRTAVAPFLRSPLLERVALDIDTHIVPILLAHRPPLRALEIMRVHCDIHLDNANVNSFISEVKHRPDDEPVTDEAFRNTAISWITRDFERLMAVPPMPLSVQRQLFEYLATDCASTLESLAVRGINKELMHELVVGLFSMHEKLAALKISRYTWRPWQVEQIAERAKGQQPMQQPFRALKSLEAKVTASAVPTLVRVLNVLVVECLSLSITNDNDVDSDPEADTAASIDGDDGSSGAGDGIDHGSDLPQNNNGQDHADENGSEAKGADEDDEDNDVNEDNSDWDRTASQMLSAIATQLPLLRVFELNFANDTVLLKPAVLSLRALACLEELAIGYLGNSATPSVELESDDFVTLLSSFPKLWRLKLHSATGWSSRWLLLAGMTCPLLEELRLPVSTATNIDALQKVSQA